MWIDTHTDSFEEVAFIIVTLIDLLHNTEIDK